LVIVVWAGQLRIGVQFLSRTEFFFTSACRLAVGCTFIASGFQELILVEWDVKRPLTADI
jgi:hypothetical protein